MATKKEKEAEKAALGCLLLEPNLWDDLATQIEEKDFTQTENKIIYRAIKKLSDQGTQLDTLTLIEAVSSDEEIKKRVSKKLPYKDWVKNQIIDIQDLKTSKTKYKKDDLISRMQSFGYTTETLEFMLLPLVTELRDPLGSMGGIHLLKYSLEHAKLDL